jgi:peroxiredoxin Q/BCP
MQKALGAFVLLFSGLGLACNDSSKAQPAPAPAVSSAPAELAVGSAAPDFEAPTQTGSAFKLSAQKGKTVVVYFYPKDETTGCTAEAEAFRDDFVKLQEKGAVIVGISADSLESHKAFAENHQLPFLLVSDPNGEIAAKFGVPFNKVAQRQTFVIGKDGTMKKIYRKVDVAGHSGAVLGDVI